MSRVLLVTPAFHGYWRSIAAALGRRRHQVVTHRYDALGLRGRIRHKLRHELPEQLGHDRRDVRTAETTDGALEALRRANPDVVVVVKGDELGADFWGALDTRRLPRVLWWYDELRRMRVQPGDLARMGPVASYSRADVAALTDLGVRATYLPLAFDPDVVVPDPRTRNDEVVFVGSRYPRRVELLEGLHAAGVPVRAFGREWSHHPLDRLRTWGGPRPDIPTGRDLGRADGYREMAAALAALNVHGDQDGFTMRTFEASGVGGVQLVDREDVGELYEPGTEVLTFTDLPQLLDQVRRVRADPSFADAVRERGRARTLADHTFDRRVAVLEELWRSSR